MKLTHKQVVSASSSISAKLSPDPRPMSTAALISCSVLLGNISFKEACMHIAGCRCVLVNRKFVLFHNLATPTVVTWRHLIFVLLLFDTKSTGAFDIPSMAITTNCFSNCYSCQTDNFQFNWAYNYFHFLRQDGVLRHVWL